MLDALRDARPQSAALLARATVRGGARARPHHRRGQHAARPHEHHVEPAGAALQRAPPADLRRRHPAHRRLHHALRPGRAAPVRDAGRLSAQRERRHRPLARQAARAAAAGARGHRPARHRLRARAAQGRGRDQGGRRRARRHQAARRHAGHGRDPGRDGGLGQVDHRGVQRRQRQHHGAGVHPRGRRHATSAPWSSAARSWPP